MSLSLPSLASPSSGVSISAPLVSSSFSSASSSSSFLDFPAYPASVLGLSSEYQSLASWYFKSGGSDFLAYLSAFYPRLSADASCDCSSGSSLSLSALHSIASSLTLPSAPLSPPGLAPPVSSFASALPQPQAPPPPPQPLPSSSGFPSAPPPSLSPALGWGASVVHSTVGVSSTLPGFPSAPPLSALSAPPSALPSQPPAPPSFPPPSSVPLWGSLGLRAPALVVSAAPAVPVAAPVAPCPLFRPFSVSEPASVSLASASTPGGSALLGSASAASGFASDPGPSSGLPQRFAAPPGASAPSRSAFAFAPDDPFAPGFEDPEAPPPPSVPDSVRAEIRRMYQYLVDLFLQAAGSPQALPPTCALFEDFFSPVSTPHQPVYLSWFERVRSALSEADTRLASVLASGRSELSLLPPRSAQYAVSGEHALGSAVSVNPSLLAMFERPLRSSLHLGLNVREAAVLEASSRSLSESLSHAMWLLSVLLGFVALF